jgi:hypothetical protein
MANFDDLIDDQDPQSAVAAQGMKQIGNAVANSEPVQNVITGKGLKDYNDMLTGAIAGDPDAKMRLAQHSAGVAMGSLKLVEAPAIVEKGVASGMVRGGTLAHGDSGSFMQYGGKSAQQDQADKLIEQFKMMQQEPARVPEPIVEAPAPTAPIVKPIAPAKTPGSYGNVGVEQGPQPKPNYGKVTWDKGPEAPIGKVIQQPSPKQPLGKVRQIIGEDPSIGNVIQQPGAQPNYGSVQVEQGPAPQPNYGKVIRKAYAEGGQEDGSQPVTRDQGAGLDPNPTWFADGGEAQSFDSLQPDSQPNVVNQDASQTPSFDSLQDDSATYGTGEQQVKAGLEGGAQGLFGPAAPAFETNVLGVKPEAIRGRAEENPITHYGTEVAGLVVPSLLTGGASTAAKFTQAGLLKGVGELVGLKGTETLASKVGVAAAKNAIDSMILSGSDEVSKMVLSDPNQSAQTAIANIGLSGLIGGGLGAAFGAVRPAFEAANGRMTSQTVADFKARINEHLANPNPVESVTNELQGHYDAITGAADEVYGPKGLKAQEIAKLVPEFSPKMMEQAQTISDSVGAEVKKMVNNEGAFPSRLTQKLQTDLDTYQAAVSSPDATPGSMFNAAQDLKQQLQSYAKFDKFVKPVDEAYDFVNSAKGLAREVREHLEDPKVWGQAAERQQAINSAFKKYLPALQDFEKKFTSKIADSENGGFIQKVDSGKIETYINQLGKPRAELKQEMLANFLKQSDKYKQVIGETHANLGIEHPIPASPLNVTMNTLKQKTLGSRIADAFIDKGLTSAGGKTVGGAIGGAAGSLLGHPGLGAIAGGHALGPFFSSVLPSIAKAVLGGEVSGPGFRAAASFTGDVAKGTKLLNNAAKGVFDSSIAVLPSAMHPSKDDLHKLDNQLKSLQTNPTALMQNGDTHLEKYLPDHSQSVALSAGNAVQYLNSIRASTDKVSPLDTKPVLSPQQKAAYNNALTIAQQPLVVMQRIKDGTITQDDIKNIQALYPSLYSGMVKKIGDELTNAVNEGKTIPYKTRIAASMFIAQPLDSTLSQSSIAAAQPQQPDFTPQGAQGNSAPKGSKSSPALQKLPSMYATGNQAREQRQQLRK